MYKPVEIYVVRYIRIKYLTPSPDKTSSKNIIAPLPTLSVEKSMIGPDQRTHLVIDKICDHLSLYRLQQPPGKRQS